MAAAHLFWVRWNNDYFSSRDSRNYRAKGMFAIVSAKFSLWWTTHKCRQAVKHMKSTCNMAATLFTMSVSLLWYKRIPKMLVVHYNEWKFAVPISTTIKANAISMRAMNRKCRHEAHMLNNCDNTFPPIHKHLGLYSERIASGDSVAWCDVEWSIQMSEVTTCPTFLKHQIKVHWKRNTQTVIVSEYGPCITDHISQFLLQQVHKGSAIWGC